MANSYSSDRRYRGVLLRGKERYRVDIAARLENIYRVTQVFMETLFSYDS